MHHLKLFFALFYRPASAMSELIDRGNWFVAALLVLLVSGAFFLTVNTKLEKAYAAPDFQKFYQPNPELTSAETDAVYRAALARYQLAVEAKQALPIAGDHFFRVANFETGGFLKFFIAVSVFYVPFVILLLTLTGGAGKFGELLPREYGSLATCALTAWAAAHLPFAAAGVALYFADAGPEIFLALWAASSLLFGVLMIFAVRVCLGTGYGKAVSIAFAAALGIVLAMNVFQLASPWMLTPFVLFYIYTCFSARLDSEISGWGTAYREKQKAKRALDKAAESPYDAAPHVQLGLLYRARRQDALSLAHFKKALSIDPVEIEANYELGKIARRENRLAQAIEHFSIVVEQNDRHALSEIWREIGATYLAAGMLREARQALEKFAERRPFDAEGLYYLGKVLKAQSEHTKARELFGQAMESVKTSPIYRRREVRYWSKLAEKEI